MTTVILFPLVGFLASGVLLWLIKSSRFAVTLSTLLFLLQLAFSAFLLNEVREGEILVHQVGNWAAPFGISMVLDSFSALLVFICVFVGFCTSLYSISYPVPQDLDQASKKSYRGKMQSFVHFMMGGVYLSFIAGDLFNLYVAFEIMLISSFALFGFTRGEGRWTHGIHYVTMNLVSSTFFLLGAGLIYGQFGSLNFAHLGLLSEKVLNEPFKILLPSIFLLVGFGIKAAAFPLFSWLPISYPHLDAPVASLCAGLLTKVGIYAALRYSALVLSNHFSNVQFVIATIAGLTMLVGVFAAASQMKTKKILSYHIISQVGYMIMGLAIFTSSAFSATVYYICHHILAKSNLFFIQGINEHLFQTDDLKQQGELFKSRTFLSLCFLTSALALAGLPPFSGFFAKYLVIEAGIAAGHTWMVLAALFTGLLTLFSMIKIWNESFLKERPAEFEKSKPLQREWQSGMIAVGMMALLTLLLGISFPWISPTFEQAGKQLFERTTYIQAVLKP